MEPSIFTQIIRGDIPSHKVYDDDKAYIFLDIHPIQPGHMLVVPKLQIDRLEDLPEDHYQALMAAVKKAMHRVVEVFGPTYRACLKVEGFDVAHAHIHVIPCQTAKDFWAKQRMEIEPNHEELTRVAERLSFS